MKDVLLMNFPLTLPKLIPLGQSWEKLGLFMPRGLLDWAEMNALPQEISHTTVLEHLDFWRKRRIALVKQTAYHALYTETGKKDWTQIVLSSECHLGPFSFLAEMNADYFVVRQAREEETFAWKKKFAYDPDPLVLSNKLLEDIREKEASPWGRELPEVDDIPWQDYDLVVSFDISVPERIVRRCPRTIWAYYSMENSGPFQKASLLAPQAGYDIFFNHGFRRYRGRPRNRAHMLEFPLQFQSSAAWHQLKSAVGAPPTRSTILVERNSWKDPLPPSAIPLGRLSGDATEYLMKMFSAWACLHTTDWPRWGNWAVESVFAGSLFLGNAASLAHISPLLPGLDCRTLAKAVALANWLVEKPSLWKSFQKLQARLIEQVAFRRPLADLTQRGKDFFQ